MASRRSTQRQVFIAGLATIIVPACIYGGSQLRVWLRGDEETKMILINHEQYRTETAGLASERLIIAQKIREAESRANVHSNSTPS
ncbi:hypothetical protein FRB93_002081 [Tulasnella sp. JGI-2019a]|nr:hypothetical protein FRB93_002081 [Tulasnella sp. JGI-2019a]